MDEIKKGRNQHVPVRLFNNNGDGMLGVAYTDVTASLFLADTTRVDMQISASMWFEVSSSAFSGLGTYSLQLQSQSLSVSGSLMYAVSTGPNIPAVPYLGSLKIVEVLEADTFNRVGVPVAADISTDIQNLSSSFVLSSGSLRNEIITNRTVLSASIVTTSASLAQLQSSISSSIGGGIDRLRITEEGRWRIDSAANTMTFYKDDGSVWHVYAISGSDGNPSVINPFERNRIA